MTSSAVSSDLIWLLVRGHNSKLHKTKYGVHFSSEPGNVANVHSKKFSGISEKRPIHLSHDGSAVVIKTRKTDATPTAVSSGLQSKKVRTQGASNASRQVAKLVDSYERPDLYKAALARTSKLVAANSPKLSPERLSRKEKRASTKAGKGKGKKGKAAEREKDADDDEDLPDLV
ncbi:hypothetical protein BT69DRAFT_1353687 [Atractiella rhizophila]|nr:hypothetical protein BT69DRAFT_1353687 [Atractiella rhizophila]